MRLRWRSAKVQGSATVYRNAISDYTHRKWLFDFGSDRYKCSSKPLCSVPSCLSAYLFNHPNIAVSRCSCSAAKASSSKSLPSAHAH